MREHKTSSSLAFDGYVPDTAEAAFVAASAVLVGHVHLGRDSSIWFGSVLRADINSITIGKRSNIQDGCMLHVTEELPVIVEDEVTVGHGAILHGCRVGRGTMVGMGAIILDGAVIGEECIIGAGSLVPPGKVIPPRSMVMGVPGKIVRSVSPFEIQATQKNTLSYVDLAQAY